MCFSKNHKHRIMFSLAARLLDQSHFHDHTSEQIFDNFWFRGHYNWINDKRKHLRGQKDGTWQLKQEGFKELR